MQDKYTNIYKIARNTAGKTQERFAEMLGLSVESIKLYESGQNMPSDDVVIRMCEVSGLHILGYWHLSQKSRVAAGILPEVCECSLPQAVIQLICRIRDFADKHRTDNLLDIAADGRIDESERELFDQIIDELQGIVQAAMTLKYAKGGSYVYSENENRR